MHYLILVSVAGKPRAVERLLDRLEALVVEETQRCGIDGLTTETIKGAGADAAREKLRELDKRKRAPAL